MLGDLMNWVGAQNPTHVFLAFSAVLMALTLQSRAKGA